MRARRREPSGRCCGAGHYFDVGGEHPGLDEPGAGKRDPRVVPLATSLAFWLDRKQSPQSDGVEAPERESRDGGGSAAPTSGAREGQRAAGTTARKKPPQQRGGHSETGKSASAVPTAGEAAVTCVSPTPIL
jgi:hypothetical protein